MKLEELLSVISENKNLHVLMNGENVGIYDGKNSIDEKFNNKIVYNVDCENDEFFVEVK